MSFLQELPVTDPAAFTDVDPDAMDSFHARMYVSTALPPPPPPMIRPVAAETRMDHANEDAKRAAAGRPEPSIAGSWLARGAEVHADKPASQPPIERASFLVRRFYALAAKRSEAQDASFAATASHHGKRRGVAAAAAAAALDENDRDAPIVEGHARKRYRMTHTVVSMSS
jgi:hypothetical protein